jgi:hypothetical protein
VQGVLEHLQVGRPNHGGTNLQLAQQMEAIQFLVHKQPLVEVTVAVHILVIHQTLDMETLADQAAGHLVILMVTQDEMVQAQWVKGMLEGHLLGNIIREAVAVQEPQALMVVHQTAVLEF